MSQIPVEPNVPTLLEADLFDGKADRGVRAEIRKVGGSLSTANLAHVAHGTYLKDYTFTSAGYYLVNYLVYTDDTYATRDWLYEEKAQIYKVADDLQPKYRNDMSATFKESTGKLEMICWAEKDGQIVSAEDCIVEVRNADGVLIFNATLAAPNAQNIFKFNEDATLEINRNYYVIIKTTVDDELRTSAQTFFTVG